MLAAYAYDNLGRRVSLTRGNGVVTNYEYDIVSRLEELAHDLASTPDDVTLSFGYNRASQITARTSTNTLFEWPAPGSSSSTAYTSNGLNQYSAVASTSYTYDGRGNLTNDGVKTYSYDVFNRLTGAAGASLEYDPLSRLSKTTSSSSVVHKLLYDGVDLIAEYNSSNALLRRYVHGPGTDEPIVWYEGASTTDRRWLIADERGSVIAVTDDSGVSIQENLYDAYGQPGGSNVGRFQYTGQTWLDEVGLYHYKARAYAPGIGRFLQSDPIGYGDGMNLYDYVSGDPMNMSDPAGLDGTGYCTGSHISVDNVDIDCGWREGLDVYTYGSDPDYPTHGVAIYGGGGGGVSGRSYGGGRAASGATITIGPWTLRMPVRPGNFGDANQLLVAFTGGETFGFTFQSEGDYDLALNGIIFIRVTDPRFTHIQQRHMMSISKDSAAGKFFDPFVSRKDIFIRTILLPALSRPLSVEPNTNGRLGQIVHGSVPYDAGLSGTFGGLPDVLTVPRQRP